MDKTQKSKYNMLVKVLAFLLNTDNAAIYSTFTAVVALVASLGTDKDDWDDLNTKEAAETTGMTTDQINAKHLMADEFEMLAAGAYSYALSINNQTLAASCHISASQIFALGNAQAAAQCDQLILIIGPLASTLTDFGITSALIIADDALITAFEATLGQAKSGEAIKSAAGIAIDNLIHNTIDLHLTRLDGLVHGPLFRTQTNFKNGYKAARVEDGLPVHHTELTVQFYKTGTREPIIGAIIKEMVKNRFAGADNVGIAHLIKFKGGDNLMFEASHPDYVTKQIIKTVPTGKKVSIIIELSPV